MGFSCLPGSQTGTLKAADEFLDFFLLTFEHFREPGTKVAVTAAGNLKSKYFSTRTYPMPKETVVSVTS